MSRSKFPAGEGWIRMDMTMKDSTPLGLLEIKRIASIGKPDNYEYGLITQHGKRVRVTLRQKKESEALA